MTRLNRSNGCVVAAIAIGACAGCLQQRTSSLIDKSEQVVAAGQETLKVLKSVNDAKSAEAAIPGIKEKYPELLTVVRDYFNQEKAANKAGGVTKSGLETLNKRGQEFLSIMQQINSEAERIRRIRGLPASFWNVFRIELVKGVSLLTELNLAPFPPEVMQYMKDVGNLMEEFGPERVVLIEARGLMDGGQIASQLQAKVGPTVKVYHIGANAEFSLMLGPIDDFDKLVSGIDFVAVTDKDPAQRLIYLNTNERHWGPEGPPRLATSPESTNNFLTPSPAPSNPGAAHLSFEELVTRFGKSRVARFEVTNFAEIANMDVDVGMAFASLNMQGMSYNVDKGTGYVGPVKDFNSFCTGIDFADIVERDDLENVVKFKIDPAKVRVKAAEFKARLPAFAARAMEDAAANAKSHAFGADSGPGSSPPVERWELPPRFDPDYIKKLSDIMMDRARLLDEKAIDALLEIRPTDIPDKAIRQKIARNFRELAKDGGRGRNVGKAIQGLALYGGKYSVPILIEILETEKLKASDELFDALGAFPDPRAAEALSQRLNDPFNSEGAIRAMRQMGPVAEDALIKVAPSDDAKTSLEAVKLLGQIGTTKSTVLLTKAARSPNQEVSEAAKAAIKAIRERSRKATAK
jgi:hypothetical protein